MNLSTVTWRQAVAALAATCIGLLAVMVVVRADGLPAVDAASARSTAWFVHQPTGRVVLVDGYRGTALGSIDTGSQGEQVTVAQGTQGAYVLNDTTAEARSIDTVDLRLGTPFGLTTLGNGQALSGVGQAGLVVVNPDESDATVVPVDGEPVSFPVEAGTSTQVARDGSIWSLVDGDLVRTTPSSDSTTELGVPGATLTMVGNIPFVVDVDGRRATFGGSDWLDLPTDVDPSEIVAQVQGPAASCGWVAANDDLWCVSADGIEESASVSGLDVDGGDLLAIAGDAAVVVRRGPSEIVQLDWRGGVIIDDTPASVSSDASLQVSATTDLVWIDDRAGETVWAVNPWSIEAIDKDAQGILVLGEDGGIVDEGDSGEGITTGSKDPEATEPEVREPDNNGIDDPPQAVDDPVTARSGASVPVEVTANDFDPDGEAVAVSAVGVPGHGSVDIGTASTVVYTPEPGYVGIDQFEYTIVDGNGTPDTASVIIDLIAADATNKPPVGVGDNAETGAGVAVIVDVLLNDVDPERDSLQIGSFSPPDTLGAAPIGEVTETRGDSGLPALRFQPDEGFEGTAIFSYRPVDSLEAIGDDVEVRVEVARGGDPNRPPIVRPDAVRLRRNVVTPVLVLVNDTDPDGDPLTITPVEPLPEGLEVEVEGTELAVTALTGAPALAPFEYVVDDGNGHEVRGSVLVAVIDDVEPNRPPVVTADSEKAVVGESVVIDVLSNDIDPDGDPLTVIDVTQPDNGAGQTVVFSRDGIQFSPAPLVEEDRQSVARFTYTVSDGNGHEVEGDVTVTVLPEALFEPPFARDDSTFTYRDVPVTVDVLRNDGDPSGGRPTLVGRPGCPSGGRATVTTDGQVRFDPPDGATGAFRCTYEVTNASGGRASASIIVSVREPEITNRRPLVRNDTLTVEVGKSASIDVTLNDEDPDGPNAALAVVSSTAPTVGTAQRNGNIITFTAGSEIGQATINYQVADDEGAVSLGYLQVRITELQNRPPIAVNDLQTIFGPGGPTQFSVLANDADPDETPGGLSLVSATRVSGDGTVSASGNVVTVTPNPSFLGQIVASYTIRDGEGLTATATVTLDVQQPPNRAPEARDDTNEVVNGGSVSTSVLFNDSDLDGDTLALTILSGPDPALGSASVGSSRAINFSAVPGASGTASIVYQVSDGSLTDDAVLRINVRPCTESTPVANDGFLKTGYQQPIAVNLGAFGANGTIVDVSGPAGFDGGMYTPPAGENGNVAIRYSVVNSCRLRASGTVTIDVNQDPVGRPTTRQVYRGADLIIPVSDLASDLEALTITGSSGAPGWVTTEAGRLVVSPRQNDLPRNYSWTTTVVDPGGLSTTVPVTVTVLSRPPVAVADTIVANGGVAVSQDIVSNDDNPEGPNIGLSIKSISTSTIRFTNGETGEISVGLDNRSVRVNPGAGEGQATFSYVIRNLLGDESAPATVTVIGPPVNNPPVAGSEAIAVTVNEARVTALPVSDPDGGPLTVEIVTRPPAAQLESTLNGSSLMVKALVPGTFEITYRVTDNRGATATGKITVNASPPPTTTPSTTIPPTTVPPPPPPPTTTVP